jgi:hypothetical protein
MLISQLGEWLAARELSLQVHYSTLHWTIWLYAPDDPACYFIALNSDLEDAIRDVQSQWNKSIGVEVSHS